MGLLPDIGFPQTGETVEEGTYVCVNCPNTDESNSNFVFIKGKKKLPKCPACGNTYWMKI